MRNYFILDGVDSRDFGVYISGQGTFNASGRDYNIIPVPGRNGDLVGPEKRFANGTLTYPAFIYSNFKTNIEAFRNFLLSHVGYHDLVDSYHPDQIRKVLFQGPFNADVQTKNDAGRFDIEFICKPQRFLASGNEVTTFESAGETETFSGSVVTFDNPGGATVSALSTAINPVQDLHGYDSPWPAGGGKNLFNFDNLVLSKVSISGTADNFVLTGTDASYNRAEYDCTAFVGKTVYVSAKGTRTGSSSNNTFLATQYKLNGTTYNTGAMTGQKQYNSSGVSDNVDAVMLFPEGATDAKLFIYVNNASSGGVGLTSTVEGLRICAAQNEPWVPYSNICPISGFSAANIYDDPAYGGLIKWNQLAPAINTTDWIKASNVSSFEVTDGVATVTVNTTSTSNTFIRPNVSSVPKEHVVYVCADMKCDNPQSVQKARVIFYESSSKNQTLFNSDVSATWQRFESVNTISVDAIQMRFFISSPSAAYTYYIKNAQIFDLTEMFGEGNEPSTVAEFKRLFPDEYYAYDNTYAEKTVSEVNGDPYVSIPISFGSTVYGGTLDVVNGTLTVRPYYASYNGETLVGPWVSSMDAYAVGTTPTTGAQVVDLGGAATTVTLTPTEVALLLGTNNMWSDTGDITVTIAFPQDQFTITNPTLFDSQPFLRVYGTGTLGINSQSVTITQADEYTDIDCEMMDCFKGTANKNPYVQFTDYNFPVLKPGVNYVSLSGITKVEITPRWWIV